MLNSAILNNLIALVIIILGLCLLVQSVQTGFKKLLKIKSRQLEESLLDLFESVLGKGQSEERAVSPILTMMMRRETSLDKAAPEVRSLYTAVMDEFRKIGRVAQSGKVMLDSIAKEDLLKVIRKIAPGTLLPGGNFGDVFQAACNQIAELQNALNAIDTAALTGSSSAKFAALRDRLAPLLNDLSAVTTGGTVNPGLAIEHVLEIRRISLTDVFQLLGEVQDSVQEQAAKATGQAKIDLDTLSKALRALAEMMTRLRQEVDAALAPLHARIDHVDTWFDTVMQSFDERYTRGMKTWGLVLSFIIVVIMNANVFKIYRTLSGNEQTRNSIIQMADTVNNKIAAGQPAPDLKQSLNDIQANVNLYQQFQLQPLTRTAISGWLGTLNPAAPGFWHSRGQDVVRLLGWIFMTLLLSVGAPFWEDVLESLFGVKNLIRQKGSLKNVETESGAGNPKS